MVVSFVRLVGAKDCFLCLPGHVAQSLGSGRVGAVMLRLSWEAAAADGGGRRCAYASWNGGVSDGDAVEVPLALAQTLGIDRVVDADRYARLAVEPLGYVPDAARVDVEPCTSDDWEILEMNAEHVEGELLRQVCIVYTGQVIPIWVHRSTLIMLRVVGASSAAGGRASGGHGCMRLTANAEVAVSPKPRPPRSQTGTPHRFFRSSSRLRVQPVPKEVMSRLGLGGAGKGSVRWWEQQPSWALLHPATLAKLDGAREGAPNRLLRPWGSRGERCSSGCSDGGGASRDGAVGGGSSGAKERICLRCGACEARSKADQTALLATVWLDDDGGDGGAASESSRSANDFATPPSSSRARRRGRLKPTAAVLLVPHVCVVLGHLALAPAVALRLGAVMLCNARVRVVHEAQAPVKTSAKRPVALLFSRLAVPAGSGPSVPRGPFGGAVAGAAAAGAAAAAAAASGAASFSSVLSAAPAEAATLPPPAPAVLSEKALRASFRTWAAAAAAAGPLLLTDGCVVTLQLQRGGENGRTEASAASSAPGQAFFVHFNNLEGSGGTVNGAPGDASEPLHPADPPPYVLLDEAAIGPVAAAAALQNDSPWTAPHDPFWDGPDASRLGGFDAPLRRAVNHFAPRLCRAVAALRGAAPPPGCLLLHGGPGAGKSTLAAAVACRLRHSPASFAHTEVVQCPSLVGSKMASVLGQLSAAFRRARARAPALVVLEDLDAICPAASEEAGAANAHAANIAEHLAALIAAADDFKPPLPSDPSPSSIYVHCAFCSGTGESGAARKDDCDGAAAVGSGAANGGARGHSNGNSSGSDVTKPENHSEGGGAPHSAMVKCGCSCNGGQSARDPTRKAVAVMATARSPDGLQASLSRCRMFDAKVEILPPAPEQRAEILRRICRVAACDSGAQVAGGGELDSDAAALATPADDTNWEELAFRTEGCMPRDLVKIVFRAAHHAALRRLRNAGSNSSNVAAIRDSTASLDEDSRHSSGAASHSSSTSEGGSGTGTLRSDLVAQHQQRQQQQQQQQQLLLRQADLEAALADFVPESLQGAALFRSSVRWADVGGLHGVKAALRGLLETPVRFKRLYERVPTRLATGALLYGPPGCGKTLVAGAVAAECGLSFIAVKGPEVLDKYIGASEAAVRALFARATAAAPCILFFDEFEAMAPRRGNDNTGVTDRVVNQLLTFLDGVEGRSGVYCLAATSRPDLIDPALLRPGRLDRLLYCGFPDAGDRLEVLRAASRRLSLPGDAADALPAIAHSERAAALTGADLQGIVNSAQLEAIHEHLAGVDAAGGGAAGAVSAEGVASATANIVALKGAVDSGSGGEAGLSARGVEVAARHLWAAFSAARPSMSARDRAEFELAYDKFRGARGADFNPVSAVDDGTLRTTLK